MKISAINQLKISDSKSITKNNNDTIIQSGKPTFEGKEHLFSYGDAQLYMYKMEILKQRNMEYPEDALYREQLLVNSGLNPKDSYKISSIAGPKEIECILKDYDNKPDVFSIGVNDVNVRNHSMRANLHIHTLASDGSMTVTELLDNAVDYASSVKRHNPQINTPFIIAITDHDTAEGAKEAIKIIADKPLKYENLKVILGAEITTFNNIATDIVNAPTNTHVLLYGIDPNEPRFNNFIETTKALKNKLQDDITDKANKICEKHFAKKDFFSSTEAKHLYNPLNKNIIGIYNGMEAYLENKIVIDQIILKDTDIVSALRKHNQPTKTDGVIEKFSEYNSALSNNNKVLKPKDVLPEFIGAIAHTDKEYTENLIEKGLNQDDIKNFNTELKSGLAKFKVGLHSNQHYMPNFKTICYNLTNQNDVKIGIAHPVDTIKNINDSEKRYYFLEELHKKFKDECGEKAFFTEAYYQSYKPGRKEFNESPITNKFFERISKVYKLIRTGSLDTHGLNIFRR